MKKEYVLNADGMWRYREITEYRVDVSGETLRNAFANDVSIKVPYLFEAGPDNGMISAIFTDTGYQWWTVGVNTIRFNCSFLERDGQFMPCFKGGAETVPMTLEWPVSCAPGMRLFLLVNLSHNAFLKAWLVAVCGNGRYWRLPVANVFKNCELCTGEQMIKSRTAMGVVLETLSLFRSSTWNADLWEYPEKTYSMFRFKHTDSGGFEAIPPSGDWTKLCDKVANETFKYLML